MLLGDPALPLPGQVVPRGEAVATRSIAERSYLSVRGPNPAHGYVALEYGITERAHIEISIYDVRGRKVARLVGEGKEPGSTVFDWRSWVKEGSGFVPGVCFARMRTDRLHRQIERFLLPR